MHGVVAAVLTRTGEVGRNLSDRIDRVVLNRVLGIPIFLAVMYAMFMLTINVGGAFIDFFDILFGTILVDGFGALLGRLGSPDWLTALLADGVGGGIQTVATFIPIIGCLFLCLSALEDSGYMARAAFVMDRFMRTIGLPGKSFVPLIVGFGCNVPAIMAARTLENQRDRTMTIVMAPFMSCGARLPVYALFAAAFFPVGGQNLVFGLYLVGIGAAVLTGLVLKRTLLQGETSPFIMELPPYHLPAIGNVMIRTWDRLKGFVLRAGRVIVGVVVVIAFLNSWGSDGSFGNQDSDKSVLASIGRAMVPVFQPMGIDEDNWPATVGIFTGLLAKEAVVGTLDALYGGLAAGEAARRRRRGRSGRRVQPVGRDCRGLRHHPGQPRRGGGARHRPARPRHRRRRLAGSRRRRTGGRHRHLHRHGRRASTAPPAPSPTCSWSCSTCPASPPPPPSTARPTCAGPCSSAAGPRSWATRRRCCSTRRPPSAATRRPRCCGSSACSGCSARRWRPCGSRAGGRTCPAR